MNTKADEVQERRHRIGIVLAVVGIVVGVAGVVIGIVTFLDSGGDSTSVDDPDPVTVSAATTPDSESDEPDAGRGNPGGDDTDDPSSAGEASIPEAADTETENEPATPTPEPPAVATTPPSPAVPPTTVVPTTQGTTTVATTVATPQTPAALTADDCPNFVNEPVVTVDASILPPTSITVTVTASGVDVAWVERVEGVVAGYHIVKVNRGTGDCLAQNVAAGTGGYIDLGFEDEYNIQVRTALTIDGAPVFGVWSDPQGPFSLPD